MGLEGYGQLLEDRAPSFELEMQRADGSLFWANMRGKALDPEDLSQGSIWTFDDITQRVKAERDLEELNSHLNQRVAEEVEKNRRLDQALVAQGRQAAMGQMIGHIAHQWRQPLGALGLVLSNLRDAHRSGRLTPEIMEQGRENGQRLIQKMSTTIADFMNFFRSGKELTRFSVLEQVHQALALVDASFKHCGIRVEIGGATFEVLGSANEFSQVLLNLLSNSKEAIQGTGSEGGEVRILLEVEGSTGVVRVLDNGCGIAEDALDRIFDPYFSTKELGTGIGLYMSKMIVERGLKGVLEARNIPGGAELALHLPLAPEVPC